MCGIVGIVGVESIYGRQMGTFRVIDALATLAFDFPNGRRDRSAFFRDELESWFVLCKSEGIDPLAWRGSEQMGVAAQHTKINVAIAVWNWGSYFDPAAREKGLRLAVGEYRRPDPRTAPVESKAAGLYMICTIEKHRAERAGYADALMYDWRGRVAECTGANIFFAKDGALHTPTPDCFLDGITRRTVIGLAKKRGLQVIERTIMPDELGTFSECFIVGTAAEVTPVRSVDDHEVGVGAVTLELQKAYLDTVRGKSDRWGNWLDRVAVGTTAAEA